MTQNTELKPHTRQRVARIKMAQAVLNMNALEGEMRKYDLPSLQKAASAGLGQERRIKYAALSMQHAIEKQAFLKSLLQAGLKYGGKGLGMAGKALGIGGKAALKGGKAALKGGKALGAGAVKAAPAAGKALNAGANVAGRAAKGIGGMAAGAAKGAGPGLRQAGQGLKANLPVAAQKAKYLGQNMSNYVVPHLRGAARHAGNSGRELVGGRGKSALKHLGYAGSSLRGAASNASIGLKNHVPDIARTVTQGAGTLGRHRPFAALGQAGRGAAQGVGSAIKAAPVNSALGAGGLGAAAAGALSGPGATPPPSPSRANLIGNSPNPMTAMMNNAGGGGQPDDGGEDIQFSSAMRGLLD